MTNSGAAHSLFTLRWCVPGASAPMTVTPSTPPSMRGRVPDPRTRPSRYTLLDTRMTAADLSGRRRGRSSAARASALSRILREHRGHGVEDGPDLGVAVAVALHGLRVEPERDVVHEGATAHLPEVDSLLATVDERVEGTDDVVAVDAEVEGEVVARAGGDACEGEIVLGGDRRD